MGFTENQLKAIEHSGSDLIISAAAGSGKTLTLTERIIRKICAGADISRMLIVTFTKAAASELKNKICTKISKELKELIQGNTDSNADVTKKINHLSSQLVKASYADICTIDSFCMKLVRANFSKLNLSGNLRIGEAGELSILESQVMEELIDELFESNDTNDDFLLVANCYSSFANEQELGKKLLELRKNLLSTERGLKTLLKDDSDVDSFLNTSFGKVLINSLSEAVNYFIPIYQDTLNYILPDPVGISTYYEPIENELKYLLKIKSCIDNHSSFDELVEVINSYSFVSLPITRLKDKRSISYFRKERNDAKDELESFKNDYFNTDESSVISSIKQNAIICRAIYNVLDEFDKRLMSKKRVLSIYSFDDIEKFAYSLLYDENGSRTAFAKSIAARYDDIYVDEYQDTNSLQDNIFKAISNKNRFMVGDIKQSIYRFRSAEPEIFSKYREIFSKDEDFDENSLGRSIFMSNNFRCDEPVIDFSNLVSDYMFKNSFGIPYDNEDKLVFTKETKVIGDTDDNKDEGELNDELDDVLDFDTANYELDNNESVQNESDMQEDNKTESDTDLPYINRNIELHMINIKGLGRSYNHSACQAEHVAKQISDMLSRKEKLPNGKTIKASDIAIILRKTKDRAIYYVEALRKYGISSVYTDNEPFFEEPHIMLVLCILNAIDNPSKDVYLAGAMRSDVFGFSLAELAKIKKRVKGNASLYSTLKAYDKGDKLQEKINDFLNKLTELKKALKKMRCHDAISFIYNSYGFLSACTAQQKSDFMKLYNIAREFEGDSFKGLFSFLRHIEKLMQKYDSKNFKGDATSDNVQIVSIHASKGLEYGICFICEIESAFSSDSIKPNLLFQRELGVVGMVGKKDGLASINPLIRKCVGIQILRDRNEEEMRILYVAMTRAIHQIIFVGSVSAPDDYLNLARDSRNYISPYKLYSASSNLSFILGGIYSKFDEYPHYFPFEAKKSDDESDIEIVSSAITQNGEQDEKFREKVDELKAVLNERFNFKYKYADVEKIPSKMSVSRLTPDVLDEKNEEIKIPDLATMPKFMMTEEEKIPGTQRGIATHIFLQFCDFERLQNEGFDSELKRLVDERFISPEDSLLVNKNHIEKFLDIRYSPLKYILKATNVHRELRFNVMLSASHFTKDENIMDEKVLVQGVMDCVAEMPNGDIILVDYKTDIVSWDDCEAVLLERYSDQVSYYKMACKEIFGRDVSRAILYSVPLGRMLDVK